MRFKTRVRRPALGLLLLLISIDVIGTLTACALPLAQGIAVGGPVEWEAVWQLGGLLAAAALCIFLVYLCFKSPDQAPSPSDLSAADTDQTQVSKLPDRPPADG
jgi:hypothetical protein